MKLVIFRPGSTKEDDGVVVFVCLGTSKKSPSTSLLVLDPDLQELGIYFVPFATPVAFHGVWLPWRYLEKMIKKD